jgi:hypothetical protein
MAYIGNTPTVGAFRKMDSIQASFDGSTTQFTIQVGGSTYQPQNANVIVCAKNGVLLEPGVDFTVTDATFTFTTAPTNGQTFFAVILGDVLDTGTPSDNTVTNAKIVNNTIQRGKFSAALNGKLLGDSIVFGV